MIVTLALMQFAVVCAETTGGGCYGCSEAGQYGVTERLHAT